MCVCIYYQFEQPKMKLHMNFGKINDIEHIDFLENKTLNKVVENKLKDIDYKVEKNTNENTWNLKIPKIDLNASIAEGTTEEILDVYIGHFEETPKIDGNIGLAAHNRGYKVNYFNRLKELKIGDEIRYTCFGKSKIYKVSNISVIEDTNWKVLENTGENMLTLITCVEDKPTLRRCVQAIEENK